VSGGGPYEPDLFRTEGGQYWYGNGVNWRAVGVLIAGTALYVGIAYGFPDLREVVPAALPVGLGVGFTYAILMSGERTASDPIAKRLATIVKRDRARQPIGWRAWMLQAVDNRRPEIMDWAARAGYAPSHLRAADPWSGDDADGSLGVAVTTGLQCAGTTDLDAETSSPDRATSGDPKPIDDSRSSESPVGSDCFHRRLADFRPRRSAACRSVIAAAASGIVDAAGRRLDRGCRWGGSRAQVTPQREAIRATLDCRLLTRGCLPCV
jgi:hypothetical protein